MLNLNFHFSYRHKHRNKMRYVLILLVPLLSLPHSSWAQCDWLAQLPKLQLEKSSDQGFDYPNTGKQYKIEYRARHLKEQMDFPAIDTTSIPNVWFYPEYIENDSTAWRGIYVVVNQERDWAQWLIPADRNNTLLNIHPYDTEFPDLFLVEYKSEDSYTRAQETLHYLEIWNFKTFTQLAKITLQRSGYQTGYQDFDGFTESESFDVQRSFTFIDGVLSITEIKNDFKKVKVDMDYEETVLEESNEVCPKVEYKLINEQFQKL